MDKNLQIAVDTIGQFMIDNNIEIVNRGDYYQGNYYGSISQLKQFIDSLLQKGLFDHYQFYFVGKDICIKLSSTRQGKEDSYEFLVNQLIRDHKIKHILKYAESFIQTLK